MYITGFVQTLHRKIFIVALRADILTLFTRF